ncbi:cell division protein Fic [Companilactobacillus sp. RD055328]|nr:cell division protein Fic [Companilactobacillus sp. RD055328]
MSKFIDPYKQENGTLKNKLEITDCEVLGQREHEIVTLNVLDYLIGAKKLTVRDLYQVSSYKKIHELLFNEIYDWAGMFRTVEIAKGESQFLSCTRFDYAENDLNKKLIALKNATIKSVDDLAKHLGPIVSDINYMHPFREGNGRSHRLFISLICKDKGYEWNLSNKKQKYNSYFQANVHDDYEEMIEAMKETLVKNQ